MGVMKKPGGPVRSKGRNDFKKKKPEEFKARTWLPRGIHITVYDIQGNAISEELANKIAKTVEQLVVESAVPSLGIDFKKG